MKISKKNILIKIVICILGILAIQIYYECDVKIPCIFFELTGLYCPGCGITRAFFSLLKLDIYQAFRYNILVITLLPFLLLYFIYKYILEGRKKIPNLIWIILLIITILFGILRNIPLFSFLKPTLIS